MGDSWHTQNIQSMKLLVKMKNVSFILQKKPYELFGQPNTSPSCVIVLGKLFNLSVPMFSHL